MARLNFPLKISFHLLKVKLHQVNRKEKVPYTLEDVWPDLKYISGQILNRIRWDFQILVTRASTLV